MPNFFENLLNPKKDKKILPSFVEYNEEEKQAQEDIEQELLKSDLSNALKIKENFPNIDFTQQAQKVLEDKLSQGHIDSVLKIKENFPNIDLTKPEFIPLAKKGFENNLSYGWINDVLEIKENFPNIDFIESTQKGFAILLSKGDIDKVLENKEKFPNLDLTTKEITTSAQECFERLVLQGDYSPALRVKENFQNIDFTEFAQKATESYLLKGDPTYGLFRLKEHFPNLDFTTKEAVESAEIGFKVSFLESKFYNSLLILQNFKVSNALEILNTNRRYRGFIDSIKTELPDILKGGKEENPEYLLRLYLARDSFNYAIENKEKYPWLSDAILGNDRFSDKLIFQFKKLGKLSKENIDLLFRTKENIIAEKSINENSPEFRKLMQDALKEYKSNPEILEYLKELGVDTDAWLNYDKEEYVRLGKAEDLSFAEMVETPVVRMEETFTKYKTSFKEIFGEYQKELQDYKIPLESVYELVKSIEEMNTRIKEAEDKGEDERKIQGMKKGLENLEARKDNPKLAPLWQKVLSDFDSIVILSNDIQRIHATLVENEDKYKLLNNKEKLETKERNDLFNYKKVIGKSINEFKDKLNLLEKRMLIFDENLPELIKPCLGEDRTVSLIQEFKENTHEVLDHFNSDVSGSKNSLEQILGEQEKDKLEGRFVKIGLWGRNPDRDLYLGNYTNCCIRIDSEHMGSESTIADYLTDTGMQVVTIVDEITNEPILAAWVYIGEDQGKPKMVIDNIEANRNYVKYFNTFAEGLEKYFADYAEKTSIGIDNISQGTNNNDIELNVELGDLYYKAGGYNRKSGYFLEAEPDDEEEYEDYENE